MTVGDAATGRLAALEDSRLGYLFKLSRPRFWLYLAGPVAVGVVFAASSTAELFSPPALVLFAYFLVPANVYLYGINDVFDADVDEENPKKEEKEVRYGGQRFVVAAVAVAGLGILALAPVVTREAWPWLAGYAVLATEYSAPPFRFKTTPLLDSISNGLYVLPGIAAYTTINGASPPLLAVAGAWLWTMGMHTFSAVPDIEPDREAGIRTLATVLGQRHTFAYCVTVWGAAALAFGLVDIRMGMVLTVYPALVGIIMGTDVSIDRAYWWFPIINTLVGMVVTMGGLWVMLYG